MPIIDPMFNYHGQPTVISSNQHVVNTDTPEYEKFSWLCQC